MAGRDEWMRYHLAWHGAFAVLAAITAIVIPFDDHVTPGGWRLALVVLAAHVAWYSALGPRALRQAPRRAGPIYLAGAIGACVTIFVLAPAGGLMLFTLYPHIWMMLEPRRAAITTASVIAAITAAGLSRDGVDAATVVGWLVVGLVSAGVAFGLGWWIVLVIRQSRHRAELIAALAETRARLAAVSREAGVLAERQRLAEEIHDTLAQGFTSVLLLLDAARADLDTEPPTAARDSAREHLRRAERTARDNLGEARALIAALTPPDLDETALPEALRRLVDRSGTDPATLMEFTVDGQARRLPATHEVTVLRIAQEALANAGRHADARHITVLLDYRPGTVELEVRDDGRGFDPDKTHSGYGLSTMSRRAQRVNGTVTVISTPGGGTTLGLSLPTEEC